MIRRPPRSTQSRSSAASDVYKRQLKYQDGFLLEKTNEKYLAIVRKMKTNFHDEDVSLSLIHISEPTRLLSISYAVFCLKKKKKKKNRKKEKIYTKVETSKKNNTGKTMDQY